MSEKENKPGPGPVIRELADYIAGAGDRPLPAEVAEKTGHHLLDTLAAIVSGSRLHPGAIAIDYVRGLGGTEESVVIGSDIVTTAVNAALARDDRRQCIEKMVPGRYFQASRQVPRPSSIRTTRRPGNK